MNFAAEFKRALLPQSRWIRTNHINPRASGPVEVTVLKNTPQEAIMGFGDETSHLTWPHRIGMTVTLDDKGWHIFDAHNRMILTYAPIAEQSIVGAAESIVRAMLEDDNEEGYIAVDLDGTLAKHTSGKYKASKIGDPIPKMVARVRRWVGHGKKVKIFTARADDEVAVNAIKKWLKDNELPDLEVTNLKDKGMIEFWDDRAVAVEKNTGEIKEAAAEIIEYLLLESPEFKTLEKNQVKLEPEERERAMKAGAVWHFSDQDKPSCAIKKAVVKGKTWYWCNTHRCGQVRPTLKGAISAFDFVKTTA